MFFFLSFKNIFWKTEKIYLKTEKNDSINQKKNHIDKEKLQKYIFKKAPKIYSQEVFFPHWMQYASIVMTTIKKECQINIKKTFFGLDLIR